MAALQERKRKRPLALLDLPNEILLLVTEMVGFDFGLCQTCRRMRKIHLSGKWAKFLAVKSLRTSTVALLLRPSHVDRQVGFLDSDTRTSMGLRLLREFLNNKRTDEPDVDDASVCKLWSDLLGSVAPTVVAREIWNELCSNQTVFKHECSDKCRVEFARFFHVWTCNLFEKTRFEARDAGALGTAYEFVSFGVRHNSVALGSFGERWTISPATFIVSLTVNLWDATLVSFVEQALSPRFVHLLVRSDWLRLLRRWILRKNLCVDEHRPTVDALMDRIGEGLPFGPLEYGWGWEAVLREATESNHCSAELFSKMIRLYRLTQPSGADGFPISQLRWFAGIADDSSAEKFEIWLKDFPWTAQEINGVLVKLLEERLPPRKVSILCLRALLRHPLCDPTFDNNRAIKVALVSHDEDVVAELEAHPFRDFPNSSST